MVLPHNENLSRSIKEITNNVTKFRAAGDKAEAKDFDNCINPPLLTGIGTGEEMIDTYSCTPLHVNLVIGLQMLNIIENEAIELDKNILESQGDSEAYTSVLQRKCGFLDGARY